MEIQAKTGGFSPGSTDWAKRPQAVILAVAQGATWCRCWRRVSRGLLLPRDGSWPVLTLHRLQGRLERWQPPSSFGAVLSQGILYGLLVFINAHVCAHPDAPGMATRQGGWVLGGLVLLSTPVDTRGAMSLTEHLSALGLSPHFLGFPTEHHFEACFCIFHLACGCETRKLVHCVPREVLVISFGICCSEPYV